LSEPYHGGKAKSGGKARRAPAHGKILRKGQIASGGAKRERAGKPTLFHLFLLPVGLADVMKGKLCRFHSYVNSKAK